MSRPAQLEQQLERVKQIQAEMADEGNPSINDPAKPPVDPSAPTNDAAAPQVIDAPVTIAKEDYDRLEQKYRTLQGMHNAEGVRSREQIAALNNALQELNARVAAAEAAPAKTDPVKYVTAEDEEEYGETLEMVRRAAREETENLLRKQEEAYLKRIAALEQQVGHVQNTVVRDVEDMRLSQIEQVKADFWNDINVSVPNWRTINVDKGFTDWLKSEDPLTGATRQQYLAQAQNEYNSSRVIKFFKEWERSQAGGPTPAPQQSDLQKYVAPGSSRGNVPVNTEKKQWTRADVGQFYQDVLQGKYANKPDEKKKIENDIYAAQAEGRVS